MAIILALEKLYDDVVARFASEGIAITNSFGWREPAKQLTQPAHINWVPGDEGNFGTMQGPKFPGRNPRPLWTPRELFTCYIQGYDATGPTDERKQWKATRLVFDSWARAIYLAAYGTVLIDRVQWVTDKKEFRFGATLRVVGAMLAETPDSAAATAPIDTKAHVQLTELSVVETFDVLPPP